MPHHGSRTLPSAPHWTRWPVRLGLWLEAACLVPAVAAQTISVTYEFAAPTLALAGASASVTVPGCDALHRPGGPPLPFRTARILLPPARRVSGIRAEASAGSRPLPGTWQVDAGQGWVRPAGIEGSANDLEGQRRPAAAAESGEWQVELLSVQRLLGHDIAVARVFPVRYVPATGELHVASRLRVTLTLEPLPVGAAAPPLAPVREAPERLAALVDNPATAAGIQPEPGAPALAAAPRCDYLLVTTAALLPAFQPLLEQKAATGLVVMAETMEQILASQPGPDAAAKLRHGIRQAYEQRGIAYVLLGGDTATVPCRYAYVALQTREGERRLPCDLYYACLDGSWNRDGDARWGEPSDGDDGGDVDLLAEVWLGRAPVDTAAEARAFVEKTVRYEQHGHRNAASVLVAAGYLGHFSPDLYPQGGRVFEPSLPYLKDLELTWLDDRPHREPQWTAAAALSALNRGPHVALYNGHAEADALLRLRPGDLAALSNPDPFLVCSVGCHAGRFDNDQLSPDSIAEQMLTLRSHGACAALVNAREGWFDPRQEWRYSGEFQARFLAHLLNPVQARLGPAYQMAKHDLLGQVETSGTMPYRWCYYDTTLLADPHLRFQAR